MKRRIPLLVPLLLAVAVLASCAAAADQTPTPVLDPQLVGQWTTSAGRAPADIDDKGQPVGDYAIGVWYVFRADGTYFSVANHMTFAIGGLAVEEGRYEVVAGDLHLFHRTWSFFPFEGSPQKKQYRTVQTDATLTYALGSEGVVRTLDLAEAGSDPVRFLAAVLPD